MTNTTRSTPAHQGELARRLRVWEWALLVGLPLPLGFPPTMDISPPRVPITMISHTEKRRMLWKFGWAEQMPPTLSLPLSQLDECPTFYLHPLNSCTRLGSAENLSLFQLKDMSLSQIKKVLFSETIRSQPPVAQGAALSASCFITDFEPLKTSQGIAINGPFLQLSIKAVIAFGSRAAKVGEKSRLLGCTHPPTLSMVVEALRANRERQGTSVAAIKSYILLKYPAVDQIRLKYLLKLALAKGIDHGILVRPPNSTAKGATGRFQLGPKGQTNKTSTGTKPQRKIPKPDKTVAKSKTKEATPKAESKDTEDVKVKPKAKKPKAKSTNGQSKSAATKSSEGKVGKKTKLKDATEKKSSRKEAKAAMREKEPVGQKKASLPPKAKKAKGVSITVQKPKGAKGAEGKGITKVKAVPQVSRTPGTKSRPANGSKTPVVSKPKELTAPNGQPKDKRKKTEAKKGPRKAGPNLKGPLTKDTSKPAK
ncbi:histone H1.8 [Tachyglossus aculeatus]|uniref:histone H1.8 n=1 Tax=Tachyglossus aculeatus TaxID=9261 RepID=UPI0018F46E9C|nr:histone H1.8 [Tachyglossus aculeatus]